MPEPHVPKYLADHLWAQAVAAGDAEARKRFAREYGEKILQTVYIWCKPFCTKDCHLRRAGIRKRTKHLLLQQCNHVLDSYAFLLDQLENHVLRRYRGEAPLSSFLFSILHPSGQLFHKYRIEFVRSKKGNVLPVWAERLTPADCAVFKELLLGNDTKVIGFRLNLPGEEVQAAAERIRDAAIEVGWGKYWTHFIKLDGREIQMPLSRSEDDENSVLFDSHDARAALKGEVDRLPEALEQLSPLDRVILRLRVVEEKPVAEVAQALGRTVSQVRSAEANAIGRLREFLSGSDYSTADVPTGVRRGVSAAPDGQATVAGSRDRTRVWNPKLDMPLGTGAGPLKQASDAGHPDLVRVMLDAPGGVGAAAHNVVSGGLEDFRCSAFYAERVDLREVSKLVASIHLQGAAGAVVREAAKRLDLAAGERMKARSAQPKVLIRRHVGIDVTVDIPGLTFEATSARLQVWEDQQFVEFRFKPAAASAASLCQGRVYFWMEGVILADVAVSILVTEESVPEIFREQMAEVNARPYRFVFPSYSHEDADIVEQLESYAAAFGDEYLRDIRHLRAGQRWNDELRGFIKKADVFQLFWSIKAADSEYVGQEWRCGLAERESRPDPYFVRPVYWTDSPAPIPDLLKPLHFAKVPLVEH